MVGYWWPIVADLMSVRLAVRFSNIDNWKKHVLKNDWPVGQQISPHSLKWIQDEAYFRDQSITLGTCWCFHIAQPRRRDNSNTCQVTVKQLSNLQNAENLAFQTQSGWLPNFNLSRPSPGMKIQKIEDMLYPRDALACAAFVLQQCSVWKTVLFSFYFNAFCV